jgi:hypothetical protein
MGISRGHALRSFQAAQGQDQNRATPPISCVRCIGGSWHRRLAVLTVLAEAREPALAGERVAVMCRTIRWTSGGKAANRFISAMSA